MLRFSPSSAVIGLAIVVAACGDRPEAPAAMPTAPTPNGSSSPVSLQMEGPSLLAPGAQAQYRAFVRFADGRTDEVTAIASWMSSSSWSVLPVVSPGVVTGGDPGEADLTVYYPPGKGTAEEMVFGPGTFSAKLRVLVLEPGTYRVAGRVIESGQPFGGVRVSVIKGRRAGLSSHTRTDGTYVMYGLTGPTDLAVSDEGLQTATRSIAVSDHLNDVDFNLQSISGYESLTGDWRLTLEASPSCGSALPPDASTRTVAARITQRGSQLTFDLSSPARVIMSDYPANGHGGVSGAGMSLRLQATAEVHPPLWVLLERLQPQRFLGIGAYGEGTRSGSVVTGWLSGDFEVYRSTGTNYSAPDTVLETKCRRKVGEHESLHAFRLER